MTSSRKIPLFILLCIMFLDLTSLNMSFPILTMLFFDPNSHFFSTAHSLIQRSMFYGLCLSIPHFMNIFFTPILSILSDSIGRKKILLTGIAGAMLFSFISGLGVLGGSLSLLFLGFFIRGIFSRTNPIAQAIIGDISEKSEKMLHMGYLQSAISLGAFIGPILGGFFATRYFFPTLNFSLPFFIAALIAASSFFILWFYFEETLQQKDNFGVWHHFNFNTIKKLLHYSDVKSILFILLLSQISWALYYQYIPPILKKDFQFSVEKIGFFIGLIAVWLTLTTMFGIRILQRYFELKKMLTASIYSMLIGLILTGLGVFFNEVPWIWFSTIPIALGDVITYSCLVALLSNAVDRSEQGKAMGLCFIIVALTWASTGLIGGYLISFSSLLLISITLLPLFIVICQLKLLPQCLRQICT